MKRLVIVTLGMGLVWTTVAADPPGSLIDLSHWRLTLPEDTELPEKPDEIRPPGVAGFEHPRWFFLNPEGDGVVFRAPCGGVTTRGSDFPRCELRETTPSGKERASWATDDGGRHQLVVEACVSKLPPVKSHVVCIQIHDAEDDVMMVRLENEKLFVERNEVPHVMLERHYELGTRFTIKIVSGGGTIDLDFNGQRRMSWPISKGGCYFKAGCYTQSNPDRGDLPDSFGETVLYRLEVKHGEANDEESTL